MCARSESSILDEGSMGGYTIATLTDVPDVLGDYPGEMRMLAQRTSTRSRSPSPIRRMPQHTGGKGSYGHFHAHQEEIYFVDQREAPVQARRRDRRGGGRDGDSHRPGGGSVGLERGARRGRARDRLWSGSTTTRRHGARRGFLDRLVGSGSLAVGVGSGRPPRNASRRAATKIFMNCGSVGLITISFPPVRES